MWDLEIGSGRNGVWYWVPYGCVLVTMWQVGVTDIGLYSIDISLYTALICIIL